MKIALNCRSFLNKQYTGIGRYTYHLLKSLSKIDHENEYLLYAKKGFFNLNKRLPSFPSKNFILKVDRFGLGLKNALGPFDIYHSPSPEAVVIENDAKIIVTVHDVIFKTFPQGHTQKTLDDTDQQFKDFVKKASKIICCSHNTASDLQKYFNVSQEKIALIYQGVDKDIFYPLDKKEDILANLILKSKGIRFPYILFVGTIEPRKNLTNILHAFEKVHSRKQFSGKLVIIGMKGWMCEGIDSLVRKLELRNHVAFMGYLSDHELRYFYNKTEAFVFPSFYEGFGYPILEAFCCGAPVVTSKVSSCPEVAGDAALLTNPYDPEDIAKAISCIVNDKALQESLRRKGLERCRQFSFHKTAQETLKVYAEVYRNSNGPEKMKEKA
jgi:glycosyltransferase involved in cell wall biosynthesis